MVGDQAVAALVCLYSVIYTYAFVVVFVFVFVVLSNLGG
jgi:hypothetical protein